MFGLDDKIAALSTGDALLVVVGVAILLGLRHATDPDHLTAVSTLIAGDGERGSRRAGLLGFSWGLGHATTLFAFGLPIVLFNSYLPERVQQGAEVAIGVVVIALLLFAFFTAVSMSIASTTFGYALSRGPVLRRFIAVAPALGVLSLAFGAWYSLGALNAVPYYF